MKKNKVLFIRSLNYKVPPRIPRMISVLKELNFDYEVVYWDRAGNGKSDRNILAYSNHSGSKITKILRWFVFLMKSALTTSATIVQPSNFETAFIPIMLKPFKRYKIIYDIRDSFAYTLGLRNRVMVEIIRSIDNFFMNFADEILICDQARIDYIKGKRNRAKVTVIMNVPQEIDVRIDDKIIDDYLVINYSGRVGKDRGLLEIAQSIQGLENVRFEIANSGNVSFEDEFVKNLFDFPNVISLGNLTHENCIREMSRCDLLLAFYNPELVAHMYPNSNKVFEAMMLKIPIFTNFGTSLADFVIKHKIGIVTEYSRTEVIKDAVKRVTQDKSILRTYGKNAYKLFFEEYNWKKYANLLREIYIRLVKLNDIYEKRSQH